MNYLEEKNRVIEDLRGLLINSFTYFYGEDYRNKISDLINRVVVVSVAKNEDYSVINKKLISLEKDKYTSDNILKVNYYKHLEKRKENDTDMYVMMGASALDVSTLEYIKEQVRLKKVKCSGWVIPNIDVPIVFMVGMKVNITTFIHEINHLLTEEVLGKVYDDEGVYKSTIKTYGIHDKGVSSDLVYEIINEIITRGVFDSFKSKYLDKLPSEYQNLVTYQTSSKYLVLDKCSFNIVSDIYTRMESIIRNSLINGNGSTIQKIIGEFNYDELRMFLLENKKNLDRYMISNKDISKYINGLSPKVVSEYKRIKENIDKSYIEYLEYISNLNSYVNELVSENKGIRIN